MERLGRIRFRDARTAFEGFQRLMRYKGRR